MPADIEPPKQRPASTHGMVGQREPAVRIKRDSSAVPLGPKVKLHGDLQVLVTSPWLRLDS